MPDGFLSLVYLIPSKWRHPRPLHTSTRGSRAYEPRFEKEAASKRGARRFTASVSRGRVAAPRSALEQVKFTLAKVHLRDNRVEVANFGR